MRITRRLTSLGVIAAGLSTCCLGPDARGVGDRPTNLASVEQILREAGASSADISWVTKNLIQNASSDDIAGYAEYLKSQTPEQLASMINGIKSDSQYSLGSDSQQHTGVPQGTLQEFPATESRIFPGFEHKWWLYIPAQYTVQRPGPLMIFLDGEEFMKRDGFWRAPVVLDNLIARKELPVMAAVFVDPGTSIAKYKYTGKPYARNRQEEYDTLSDAYAAFLLEEIFPTVRKYFRIVDDADGRGIAGCSSGGIAAFTAAWQRSDQFRKVISFSGSFADLRGGQAYPDLVRRGERKPIRVFQHVGANDIVFDGLPSWLEENNLMSAALDQKHYDHRYVVDQGTHCSVGAASILPDAMRWVWRDYPH